MPSSFGVFSRAHSPFAWTKGRPLRRPLSRGTAVFRVSFCFDSSPSITVKRPADAPLERYPIDNGLSLFATSNAELTVRAMGLPALHIDRKCAFRAGSIDFAICRLREIVLEKREFYIDGRWDEPRTSRTLSVIDPSTGQPFAIISAGDESDIDRAVDAARRPSPTGRALRRASASRWWRSSLRSTIVARPRWRR